MDKKKVIVGMSGGVDSSVAAHLLLEQGYDVSGVTMMVWQEDDPYAESEGSCCGLSAVEDARRVAYTLGIPYHVLNFRREFRHDVMEYFVREYEAGRTPNPCIACNRHVKWESLLRRSMELGADYIATGHYARVTQLENGRWTLRTADGDGSTAAGGFPKKDQTYALVGLTQDQLAHTLMPVGLYTKEQIRRIAKEQGLPVADKADSEDICFVPDGDYASFIEGFTGRPSKPGHFVDEEGHVLGTHKGIIHYTVGQRRGLGISAGSRIFVKELRPGTNEVVLSGNDALFSRTLRVSDISFMGIEDLKHGEKMRVFAKIRYNHRGASAIIERIGRDEILCTFDEAQRAVTPGQAAVFYLEDYIACGGTIQ